MNTTFLIASFNNISPLFAGSAKTELITRLTALGYECMETAIQNNIYITKADWGWKLLSSSKSDYVLGYHKDRGSVIFDMAKPNDVSEFLVAANQVALYFKGRILNYRGLEITIKGKDITINSDALIAEAMAYARTQV